MTTVLEPEPLMSASAEKPSRVVKKREPGTGTVAPHRKGFIARLPRSCDPARPSLGVFPTEDQAHDELDAALVLYAAGDARPLVAGAPTLADIGDGVMRARVAAGIGGSKDDKYRWKAVLRHDIATKPLALLCEDDVIAWRNDLAKRRARSTVKNTLNLLRAVLEHARAKKLIGQNPAAGVKPPKKDPSVVHEPWTVLTPEEQRRVHELDIEQLDETPRVKRELVATRLMVLFVAGVACRPGEAWNLELPDLVVGADVERPRVTIRFGSPGRLPKGRRIGKLPVFGHALQAARAWLELLPEYCPKNKHGLVFPTERGARRRRIPRLLKKLLELAGVTTEPVVGSSNLPGRAASNAIGGDHAVTTQLGDRAVEVLRAIAAADSTTSLEKAEQLATLVLDALPALEALRRAGGAA